MTQVKNVRETKTYKVCEALLAAGFNAKLSCAFDYSYNKDNNFLSISVEEANDRTVELWNIAAGMEIGMEIILSRYVKSNDTHFTVRKHIDFAEFITREVWESYYELAD